MIAPDSIPFWFAVAGGIVASIVYLAIELHFAAEDPNPEYSDWDKRDGLPHTG